MIVAGSYLLSMDEKDTRIKNGAVAIDNGKIVAVATLEDIRDQYESAQEIVHENAVIMPGLINAHTHETLTRGLHEDLPLDRWLEEVCFPIENNYIPEDIYAAALMTQLEFIRGGITTFIDIFRFADQAIKVLSKSGLRAIFSPQMFDPPSEELENIDKTVDLIEKYHGSQNGRVSVWFGPHAPYSCSPASYARSAELADKYGVGVHTHLCETKHEVINYEKDYGFRPVEMLKITGVLDVPCLLAHSIHLNDEEIELLANKKETAGIAYNPISNMKLADGVARIPEMLKAGCTVGLGTDSNLSNNGPDLFAEMRIGSYLQKLSNDDATIMPSYVMLKMATMGSAKALKMDHLIGSLEVGKSADLIFVSFESPHMWPIYYENPSNIVEQLVYSARASDVVTTIVDGKILMHDRHVQTIDEKEAFQIVHKRAPELYSRGFPNGFLG